MKIFVRMACAAFLFASALAAHATTFNFSFDAEPEYAVTGHFNGTANGNIIENISNLWLYDALGVAYPGSGNLVFQDSWWKPVSISIDGTQNELYVVAADDTAVFTISSFSGFQFSSLVVSNGSYLKNNGYTPSSWHISVAAVPEPATYAMLLAGLSLLGGVARRRQKPRV